MSNTMNLFSKVFIGFLIGVGVSIVTFGLLVDKNQPEDIQGTFQESETFNLEQGGYSYWTNRSGSTLTPHGSVNVTWVSDPIDVETAFNYRELTTGIRVQGFTNTKNKFGGGDCTIYLHKPIGADDTYQIQVLGHEVLHCFVGQFHN